MNRRKHAKAVADLFRRETTAHKSNRLYEGLRWVLTYLPWSRRMLGWHDSAWFQTKLDGGEQVSGRVFLDDVVMVSYDQNAYLYRLSIMTPYGVRALVYRIREDGTITFGEKGDFIECLTP